MEEEAVPFLISSTAHASMQMYTSQPWVMPFPAFHLNWRIMKVQSLETHSSPHLPNGETEAQTGSALSTGPVG